MGKKAKKGGKKKDDGAGEDVPLDKRTELYLQAKALKKQLQAEERQAHEFQQQREKLNYFWIVEKKNLEDKKAEVRNKRRELQDLQEKHEVEIKVYKSRVKHLLYEHQNESTAVKTDAKASLKISQDGHRAEESQLKKDKRSLKVELKETEICHDDYLKTLKQEQDHKITELRQVFERKAKELQLKYERQSRTLREQLEAQRKVETQRIEHRKDSHIDELMKNHERAFGEIKNYYNDITHNNLDLIKTLKEEVSEMKRKESADEKLMFEIAQENKRMSEPLKQALQDVDRLRNELEEYKTVKEELKVQKSELLILEEKLESLQWEHEVLQQRYEIVEKERSELYDKFQSTIYDVQQKTGFRNLLLEKKVATVDQELEKIDGYLNEVVHQLNLEPGEMGRVKKTLEDVMEAKTKRIQELQEQLVQIAQQNSKVVHSYEQKMAEYGIPFEELGFKPQMIQMPNIQV